MSAGTSCEQGEVFLVPFPFTDLSSVKKRPVLILSRNDYNHAMPDIITCGITSNLKDRRHAVSLRNEQMASGALPFESVIRVDKLFTLEKTLLRRRLGSVDTRTFVRVKDEFLRLF